jgi:TolB protein
LFPSFSPDGKRIAFEVAFGAPTFGRDIFVMNADGTNQVNLTAENSGNDQFANFSPDGARITFSPESGAPSFDREIYVMNADGTNKLNLTNSPSSSDLISYFSPDGKRIVFISDRVGGGTDIFVMNADACGFDFPALC